MSKHKYKIPNAPFGWRNEIVMVRDENEQRALRIARPMLAQGATLDAIATRLNAAGLTNRRGHPYTASSVQVIKRALEQML